MKALILAAGFGTRLEKGLKSYNGPHREQLISLVDNKPKGLIEIRGKPIATSQLEQLMSVGISSDDIYVYTNSKHYGQYLEWAKPFGIPNENIIDNGVESEAKKNEQAPDLLAAIDLIGYGQPLIVFASDTLVYDQNGNVHSLKPMSQDYFIDNYSRVIAYYKDKEAYRHGIITVDNQDLLTSFTEKPAGVEEGWVNASVYLFSPAKLKEMEDLSEKLKQLRNPLQLIWPRFKLMRVAARLDVGSIDDVIIANGLDK